MSNSKQSNRNHFVKAIVTEKITNTRMVGIVKAKNWFDKQFFAPGKYAQLLVRPEDFIVGEWSDYHDGEKNNIEGRTTIAICKDKELAILNLNALIKNRKNELPLIKYVQDFIHYYEYDYVGGDLNNGIPYIKLKEAVNKEKKGDVNNSLIKIKNSR